MSEFYKVKAEVTSGEISLAKSYLLFKKLMLISTLFTRCMFDIDKELSGKRKKYNLRLITALLVNFINTLLIIFCVPASVITFSYIFISFNKLKKESIEINKLIEESIELTHLADIIYNTVDILKNKISAKEISHEEEIELTKQVSSLPIKEVFDEKTISMFSRKAIADNQTLEEFEKEIFNEELVDNLLTLILRK